MNQIKTMELPDGVTLKLDIWDMAGGDMFENQNRNFYAGTDCAVILYAIDSMQSFKSVVQYIQNVQDFCSPNCIKVLVGNKCDLVDSRMVSTDDGNECKDSYEDFFSSFCEVSAIPEQSHMVHALFQDIALKLRDRKNNRTESFRLKNSQADLA